MYDYFAVTSKCLLGVTTAKFRECTVLKFCQIIWHTTNKIVLNAANDYFASDVLAHWCHDLGLAIRKYVPLQEIWSFTP